MDQPQDIAYTPEDVSDNDHRYAREPGKQHSHSGQLRDPHLPGEHAEAEHVHVVPVWLLAVILIVLLFLTWVTVAVTWVNLGELNVWAALGIAVVKGSLVLLYFMHLRWDSSFNRLALIAALVFLTVFIGITLMDTAEYAPNYKAPITHLKVTANAIQ